MIWLLVGIFLGAGGVILYRRYNSIIEGWLARLKARFT